MRIGSIGQRICSYFLLAGLSLASAIAQIQQVPEHLPQDAQSKLLARLPEDWQAEAIRFKLLDLYDFRHLYAISGDTNFFKFYDRQDSLRYRILRLLVEIPGGQDFVLSHLFDPMAVSYRVGLYTRIGSDSLGLWRSNSQVIPVLQRGAEEATSAEESLAAFSALHMLQAHRLRDAVELSLHSDRFSSSDRNYPAQPQERAALLKEAQELDYLLDGVDLPEFLRAPAPLFSIAPDATSLRVAIIGDYGTMGREHAEQKKVADAMLGYAKKRPFDLGITVGDNFYFEMKSPNDPLWKADFEDLYGPLKITFYPAFGNHDWDGQMPAIEMLHSQSSAHWHLPSPYYTYTAGPVQFFVINTGDDAEVTLGTPQLEWLSGELQKSKAPWKIVYGHFPIKDTEQGMSWKLYERLMPVLRGRADVYIAGHMHNLEHLKPEGGVNLFVTGASGQAGSGSHEFASEAYFVPKEVTNGFAVMEIKARELTMRFLDDNGSELYSTTLKK